MVDGDSSVLAAVRRDLAEIGRADEALAVSGLAALAVALAARIDAEKSAHAVANCANSLRDVLERLRELAPAPEAADTVTGLAERTRLKLVPRASS